MKRYAIWDKQSPVITPIGEVLSAEEWMCRYPMARLDSVTVICAYGEVNGGIFDTLGQMIIRYENEGCDFSACSTDEEKLAAIETFEDNRLIEAQESNAVKAMNEELTAASLASIAASMEYQNMMTLPDEEV